AGLRLGVLVQPDPVPLGVVNDVRAVGEALLGADGRQLVTGMPEHPRDEHGAPCSPVHPAPSAVLLAVAPRGTLDRADLGPSHGGHGWSVGSDHAGHHASGHSPGSTHSCGPSSGVGADSSEVSVNRSLVGSEDSQTVFSSPNSGVKTASKTARSSSGMAPKN